MKKIGKIITVFSICIGSFLVIIWLIWFLEFPQTLRENEAGDLTVIVSCWKDYIKANEGSFPSSKEELINKGFIKKETPYSYSIRISDSNIAGEREWLEICNFENFDIYYGIDVNDIDEENRILYVKGTRQQIFLVNGRFDKSGEIFKNASYDLYKEMIKYKK